MSDEEDYTSDDELGWNTHHYYDEDLSYMTTEQSWVLFQFFLLHHFEPILFINTIFFYFHDKLLFLMSDCLHFLHS